jgi:hypothetical protein
MKKEDEKDKMLDHYDFTGARRGAHHKRYVEGHNVRQLSPELAEQSRDD